MLIHDLWMIPIQHPLRGMALPVQCIRASNNAYRAVSAEVGSRRATVHPTERAEVLELDAV
jgi:hypothetical protein